ncbi:hypothetical protein GDO86_010250 [Hymenochirus boettgeri]|uniref:Uncharacterized protein n=1 Tax=Hymenochirus boettgeri TaxID=247094 RepID=A0A8T2JPB0_9PIPI|nr:hypothetical protein GDO86_010250 [Hymenochirus boettgeri]
MVSRCLRHCLMPCSTLGLRHLSVSNIPGAARELIDLGFNEEQVGTVLSLKPSRGDPQHRISCIKELLFIGLSPQTVVSILIDSPELRKTSVKEIQDRTDNLRSLGLGEGFLHKSLSRCPSLLSLPRSQVLAAVKCLKQRCKFSAQQVTDILCSSPEAITQDPSYLEEVFQYVYFRMGGTHKDIITSGLFLMPLNEIRVRHQFLERLGRFCPPNKKGVSPSSNPKLKQVLRFSERDFLTHIAQTSSEELHVFRNLLAREEKDSKGDEDDEENIESTDSEEENTDSEKEESDSEEEEENRNDHNRKKKR